MSVFEDALNLINARTPSIMKPQTDDPLKAQVDQMNASSVAGSASTPQKRQQQQRQQMNPLSMQRGQGSVLTPPLYGNQQQEGGQQAGGAQNLLGFGNNADRIAQVNDIGKRVTNGVNSFLSGKNGGTTYAPTMRELQEMQESGTPYTGQQAEQPFQYEWKNIGEGGSTVDPTERADSQGSGTNATRQSAAYTPDLTDEEAQQAALDYYGDVITGGNLTGDVYNEDGTLNWGVLTVDGRVVDPRDLEAVGQALAMRSNQEVWDRYGDSWGDQINDADKEIARLLFDSDIGHLIWTDYWNQYGTEDGGVDFDKFWLNEVLGSPDIAAIMTDATIQARMMSDNEYARRVLENALGTSAVTGASVLYDYYRDGGMPYVYTDDEWLTPVDDDGDGAADRYEPTDFMGYMANEIYDPNGVWAGVGMDFLDEAAMTDEGKGRRWIVDDNGSLHLNTGAMSDEDLYNLAMQQYAALIGYYWGDDVGQVMDPWDYDYITGSYAPGTEGANTAFRSGLDVDLAAEGFAEPEGDPYEHSSMFVDPVTQSQIVSSLTDQPVELMDPWLIDPFAYYNVTDSGIEEYAQPLNMVPAYLMSGNQLKYGSEDEYQGEPVGMFTYSESR